MPHNVLVPAVGESITEGTISRLLVAEGALVSEATPLFELETDKISAEVQAGASGAVHFRAKEGDVLPVGGVVAEIDTSKAPATPVPGSTAKPAEPSAAVAAKAADKALSPAVRKMVADAKLEPERMSGSGKGGRLTKGDVLAASEQAKSAPAATTPASAPPAKSDSRGGASRKRLSPLRARIAQRLVQAQHSAAILTTFNEIDMSACMDMRKRFKEEFEKKLGVSLGFMSFFTAAAVQALQRYPMVNSQIDGADLVSFDHINIGVAVGTERGLVVPVLRNAQRLSFADIEREIKSFALKAREGKLTLEDMQEGTFTITNGGVYGSLMSTPIVNPPQSGILGMHAIKPRPVAVDGQVVVRPMMYVALSYDHRLVDGADAVGFLVRIKELIEAPERMVLGCERMACLRATGSQFLAERFMAESPLAHCARIGTACGPDGAPWPEAVIAISLAPWRELKARLDDASRFLASARAELGRLRSQYVATHLTLDLPVHRPHARDGEDLVLEAATLAALGALGIDMRVSLLTPDFAGAAERHPRIIVHPQVCGGRPAIRGTRVLVRNLVDALARGQTLWQIQQDFPDIAAEDLAAAVAFIAEQAEHA